MVIELLHNLLLGTAKNMFHKRSDSGLLKKEDLKTIQNHIDNTVVRQDIGSIPNKIEAGSAGMSVYQWKKWMLI